MKTFTGQLMKTESWREAVVLTIKELVRLDLAFSSGEITKIIRENRPDLRFSHWDVGQYIRDMYHSSGFAEYSNDGKSYFCWRRQTTGDKRTPPGRYVFVYGPTYQSIDAHNFEVEIPYPAYSRSAPYQEYGSMADEGPKRGESTSVKAKVHADGRLCVPRIAFDKFMEKTGKVINRGDEVFVSFDKETGKITVSTEKKEDSKGYDLTRDRGRVKYTIDKDFPVHELIGNSYDVNIIEEEMEIELK